MYLYTVIQQNSEAQISSSSMRQVYIWMGSHAVCLWSFGNVIFIVTGFLVRSKKTMFTILITDTFLYVGVPNSGWRKLLKRAFHLFLIGFLGFLVKKSVNLLASSIVFPSLLSYIFISLAFSTTCSSH